MFTNLTAEPEFITAIPDLLDQDPPESLREELEAKGVEREAFVMDDLCPSGNLTKAEIINFSNPDMPLGTFEEGPVMVAVYFYCLLSPKAILST